MDGAASSLGAGGALSSGTDGDRDRDGEYKKDADWVTMCIRLRLLREQHGWLQREMARLCGFGESQIRNYESGETDPSSTALRTMAELLGVSTDYLVGLTDDPPVPIRSSDLSEDEQIVVDTLRRSGWSGIAHLGVDRLTK